MTLDAEADTAGIPGSASKLKKWEKRVTPASAGCVVLFTAVLVAWAYLFHYSGHNLYPRHGSAVSQPRLHITVAAKHEGRSQGTAAKGAAHRAHERPSTWRKHGGKLLQQVKQIQLPVEPATGWAWHAEPLEQSAREAELWSSRQAEVVQAFQHSWTGYVQYAWGKDELAPLSKSGRDSFGGIGATLIDALDTLHLMGLHEEFQRAQAWVADGLDLQHDAKLSLFETVIRIVGGLLSAYDASHAAVFLEKADELAGKVMLNMLSDGTGTRHLLPSNDLFLDGSGALAQKERPKANMDVSLAEFGSFMAEWLALTARTGNAGYADFAEGFVDALDRRYPKQAFLPVWFNRRSGRYNPGNTFTVGGLADSYFESLLKMWLLKGKRGEAYRSMWERAMDEVLAKLVRVSAEGLTYVGHISVANRIGARGTFKPKMDHLACYLPANLALGVAEGAVSGAKAGLYAELAANLTHTCWQMYAQMPTGLAPEAVFFDAVKGMRVAEDSALNQLRPEAVESLWHLWLLTGHVQYREWGWAMFQAFQRHSRGEAGFHSIKDVTVVPPVPVDTMESFWLAETLKYFYLLFGEPELLSLSKWVLNTEAHPLLIHPPRPHMR